MEAVLRIVAVLAMLGTPVYAHAQDTSDQGPPGDQYPNYAPIPAPLQDDASAPSDDPAAAPQTWGDTPYAPMVPPVMRDQPVQDQNPMAPYDAAPSYNSGQ